MSSFYLFATGVNQPKLSQKELNAGLIKLESQLTESEYPEELVALYLASIRSGVENGWPSQADRRQVIAFRFYLEYFAEMLPLHNGLDLRSVDFLYESEVVQSLFEVLGSSCFGPVAAKDQEYWLNYIDSSRGQLLLERWSEMDQSGMSALDLEIIEMFESLVPEGERAVAIIFW